MMSNPITCNHVNLDVNKGNPNIANLHRIVMLFLDLGFRGKKWNMRNV